MSLLDKLISALAERKLLFLSVHKYITWTGYTKPMDNTYLLSRDIFTDRSTTGTVYVDGKFLCFSLERSCRKTGEPPLAIPNGLFELELYDSPTHGEVPLLKNVPGHEWIEIHIINKPEDSKGCIGLGFSRDTDWISRSADALKVFIEDFKRRLVAGKVFISINGGKQNV